MSAARSIDLNCDVGELPGAQGRHADRELIGLVSSVNIACGGHAGDRKSMEATVRVALACGAVVGAHPSYADVEGFGRRSKSQLPAATADALRAQVSGLLVVATSLGARVAHVKPHGALYNDAAVDAHLATAVAQAVKDVDASLVLVGLAGRELLKAGAAVGLRVAAEGFCDRAYAADGILMARGSAGAVIADAETAARQAVALAQRGDIDTLCIHGDEPAAVLIAAAVRSGLGHAGFTIACPWSGVAKV